MESLTGFLLAIAQTTGAILAIFGGATALMGWYDDRPDNITRGFWTLGSGAALLIIAGTVGGFIQTIPTNTGPSAPTFGQITDSMTKDFHDYGPISGFIIWAFKSTVNVAKAPIACVQVVTSVTQGVIGGALGSTITDIISTGAMALYGFFALLEVSDQYKKISQMGGGDLASFGIPVQLIIRLAVPLFCLNSKFITSVFSITLSIANTAIGWGMNIINSPALPTEDVLASELQNALTGNSFGFIITKLLLAMIVLTSIVVALFTVGRSIALMAGVGIRIVGYVLALPFGIASFASEEFQDMGRKTVRGLLGASLQGLFIVVGVYLATFFAGKIAAALIDTHSLIYSVLAAFVISFATLAGAEEGNALGKEVFG